MTSDNGFIKLRRGLLEHIETGKMNGNDLLVYVMLHFHADYQSGVVYHKSAPYFASLLRMSVWKIQESLRRLETNKYIKRFNYRGQVSGYDIIINKYTVKIEGQSNVLYSKLKYILILADKSSSLEEIAWTVNKACNLRVGQAQLKCNLNQIQTSPIIDIKNIRLIDDKDKKPPKEYDSKSVEFKYASLLLGLILKRNPKHKQPKNLQGWCKHIDRMLRLDGRTPKEIESVLQWSQSDPFWQDNILSTAKLRKQFDQLKMKMEKVNGGKLGRHSEKLSGDYIR